MPIQNFKLHTSWPKIQRLCNAHRRRFISIIHIYDVIMFINTGFTMNHRLFVRNNFKIITAF